MPKLIAPLSELQVKKAKPADQPYRLADGKGLYLQIMPNGSKYWRMKYRIGEKEKTASFGVYPEVSLAEARDACIAARKQISAGIDPSAQKQQVKREKAIEAASSFEIVAREWFENQKDGWSEVYAGKVINSLEVDVFPRIGSKPIRDIDAPQMLEILRTVESRGVRETAKRVLQRSRAVFQYGIMTGRCTRNPASDIDTETVLKRGPGVRHMARVKSVEIPQLMRDIADYQGDVITRLALRLMADVQGRQIQWMASDRCDSVRERLDDKVPRIAGHAYPAHTATPVLQRIAALRFGLIDLHLALHHRQHGSQLLLLLLRLVRPDALDNSGREIADCGDRIRHRQLLSGCCSRSGSPTHGQTSAIPRGFRGTGAGMHRIA